MNFFQQWGQFMMAGAKAFAAWEIDNAHTILHDRKRILLLGLLLIPVLLGGIAFAEQIGGALPDLLGGKKAYSPAFYSTGIFIVSILIGLGAGLITGCIGAGGGFIIAPALMSAGIKGILAVGTDLFHIFAKAIMGSIIHRKLGNVSVPLAVVFLIGAILGATAGGLINRVLYELNPVLSDAFITTIYALMLGFLGCYAMLDFLKARKSGSPTAWLDENSAKAPRFTAPGTRDSVSWATRSRPSWPRACRTTTARSLTGPAQSAWTSALGTEPPSCCAAVARQTSDACSSSSTSAAHGPRPGQASRRGSSTLEISRSHRSR